MIRNILAAVAAIAILAVAPLQAQVTPTDLASFTLPATIASETTTNVAQSITVQQGKDLAVQIAMVATNASTANVIMKFDFSIDGTNYTTANTITKTNALNGTTAVIGYHVIPSTTIGPARTMRLYSIQNVHDATITLSGVQYGWAN